MNKDEYRDYQRAVTRFFEQEGVNNLSAIADDDGTIEPSFSYFSSGCDCCGRTLGGNAYQANGFNPTTGEIQEYDEVCEDCIYYAEYGQLDDQTMLDITLQEDDS